MRVVKIRVMIVSVIFLCLWWWWWLGPMRNDRMDGAESIASMDRTLIKTLGIQEHNRKLSSRLESEVLRSEALARDIDRIRNSLTRCELASFDLNDRLIELGGERDDALE